MFLTLIHKRNPWAQRQHWVPISDQQIETFVHLAHMLILGLTGYEARWLKTLHKTYVFPTVEMNQTGEPPPHTHTHALIAVIHTLCMNESHLTLSPPSISKFERNSKFRLGPVSSLSWYWSKPQRSERWLVNPARGGNRTLQAGGKVDKSPPLSPKKTRVTDTSRPLSNICLYRSGQQVLRSFFKNWCG